MANEENLIPFTSDQSREEAVKNGHLGGVASGVARRKKKALREAAAMFASLKAPKSAVKSLVDSGLSEDDADMQMALIAKMFSEGMKGNTKAAGLVFGLLDNGETTEETESSGLIDALNAKNDVWENGDDSDFLPEDNE